MFLSNLWFHDSSPLVQIPSSIFRFIRSQVVCVLSSGRFVWSLLGWASLWPGHYQKSLWCYPGSCHRISPWNLYHGAHIFLLPHLLSGFGEVAPSVCGRPCGNRVMGRRASRASVFPAVNFELWTLTSIFAPPNVVIVSCLVNSLCRVFTAELSNVL